MKPIVDRTFVCVMCNLVIQFEVMRSKVKAN